MTGIIDIRCVLAVAASIVSSLVAEPARAEIEDPLEPGRAAIRSFDYENAIEHLEQVAADASSTANQRVEALELIGAVSFNLGRRDACREVFQRLLQLDPGHELSEDAHNPRIHEFFSEVRGAFIPELDLEMMLHSPEEAPPGPLRIEATLTGTLSGVEQVLLLSRAPGEGTYASTGMHPSEEGWNAELTIGAEGLELYAEARAPSGRVLARAASAADPARVVSATASDTPVDEPMIEVEVTTESDDHAGDTENERPRWYRSWWFWTIVGTVVVTGGALAIGLTVPENREEASLGSFGLE